MSDQPMSSADGRALRPFAFPPVSWAWLVVSVVVILLDWETKQLASQNLQLYRPVEVFSWLNITLAHNYGAAFSFLAGAGGWQRWFFTVLASVISVVLLVWLIRLPRREWVTALGLALILGGAIGTVADRIRLGYVVDFIDVPFRGWPYPAFNGADSAITCGVVLLLVDAIVLSRRREGEGK